MSIDNQACNIVILIRDERLGEKPFERRLRQNVPRGHSLLRRSGSNARKVIARTRRTGERHDLFQVIENK